MNIKQFLKQNKKFFFVYKKITSKDFRKGYNDHLSFSFKDKSIVNRELALIESYWQCDPMHYFRYRLFEKKLSDEELLDYIPPYFFYNFHMRKIYSGINLNLYKSKSYLNSIFLSKKIPTPLVISVLNNGEIKDFQNNKISFTRLYGMILNSEEKLFFLKPDDGQGGDGILILKKIGGDVFLQNRKLTSKILSKVIKGKCYVLQEGIRQREDISEINNSSVNTLRVITQNVGDLINIPVAVMRIGRANSYVDNSAQGGISVEINVETGELFSIGHVEHGRGEFLKHPDSQFLFDGFRINDWNWIKKEIKNFASKIPQLKEIGWDIALGVDNLYVLEINTNYGLDHLQCTCGGMRRILNVKN